MPALNFRITADDSEIKKTLEGINQVAKKNGETISKELSKTIDKQNDAVKASLKQKNVTLEIVKATEDEAKATDKVTEAIKRKNAAFDANGKQIRPVQLITGSQADIDAANASKQTIASGPVVGPAAEYGKATNEALAYGNAAKQAFNEAVTAANNSTVAYTNNRKAIASLKVQLKSYQESADSTTDSKRLGEYNNKMRETQAEIARLRNVGKAGYDDLGNKLTATAGKQEILTQKLRMYQDALSKAKAPQSFVDLNRKIEETEIQLGKLKNAGRVGFDEMGNAIGKSTSKLGGLWQGLKTVANILPGVGIAGLLAFATEPILNYIATLDIFGKKVSEAITKRLMLNEALLKGAQNAQSEITTLKLLYNQSQNTNLSLEQRKEAYSELQRLYPDYFSNIKFEQDQAGKTKEAYDSLTTSIIATARARAAAEKITENASRQLANEQAIADAEAEYNRQGQVAKRSLGSLKSSDPGSARFNAQQAASAEKEQAKQAKIIREAKRDTEILNSRNLVLEKNITKQIQAGAKLNGSVGGEKPKDPAKQNEAILNQQIALQQKIDDINKEYARKSLTKDQEELQSVRDKFKKIADEAARFNANPKNKLNLVDTSQLAVTRDNAIEDLIYRQQTEKLKLGLDKQKALYADFEDYRTRLGEEAATDRFSREMNVTKSYLQLLKDREKEITDITPEKRTGAQSERLEVLQKQIKAEEQAEQKKYDTLVKEFISFSDKRKALTEQYNRDYAALENNGEAQAARTLRYQEDLKSLDDANVQKLDAYKALFKGIENLSDANAKKVIENAQAMLKTLVGEGKISKEMADQISKMITETNRSLKDRMPDRLISLANQIDAVADAVSGVDEGFGKMLHTVANVVGQVGNIKKGVKDLESAQKSGDTLGQLGAGLGIFGAGLSILTSVSKLFDKSAQREEQAAYARDLQNKQTEAMNKALERQIELIDEAYGTERITKYTAAIAQAEADQKKYQDQLAGRYTLTGNDKQADAMIATYNEGGSLPGMSRAFLEKTFQQSGFSQLPKDFEQLQRLFEEGKLDAQTGIIVANLIEAAQKSKELTNNLNAERIGTTLDSMADSFLDRLTKGTAEYGDFLEDIIKTSLLEGFKSQMIEKSLQPFYDKYAEFAEGGLTKDEIDQLKQLKDQIIADGEKELANLEAITGETLRDDNTSGSALQKGITQITSDQASALEGIARGSYDYLKRLFESFEKSNLSGSQQLDIAMRGLVWQQQTAENTAATVGRLDTAITELKAINKNTGGTGTSFRGGGFGD